ncbi:MAG: decaprenyl-phosphate phosphoribosyltransferase [Flavobacteriales bacterium]|nr:decaprenyl-phosphate phosphoribosyltransferase [Flavobacteriales bacterium]|tara:strand:+ start:23671 stop:24534 length:864 start_codon:yes stop_codon:yes gene_type:complete
MKTAIKLLRVKQWVKNVFVFLPAFFGGVFFEVDSITLLLGFFAFSLLASSIYIINDLKDAESDKRHPKKRNRPIASGKIKPLQALIIAAILFLASGFTATFFLPSSSWFILALYFTVNVLYSFYLKHLAIVDLILVASGFVFRIIVGSLIASVQLSYWLLLMTFLFSLFIVIAKRRDDFTTTDSTPYLLRKVNKYYNISFLNTAITIVSTLMMVCYVMYTFNSNYFEGRNYFALISSVLVIVGLLRYFQAIFVEEKGGSPTDFAFKDRFIQVVLLLWLAIFAYLIYS